MSLLVLLMLISVGLPLTIHSDGTLQGHVQLLLTYSLGLATLVLSLSTLWAGCAAVSLEIQERQMQMVVTKPVTRLQVWAGKWLGLMCINVLLLSACAGAVYGLLRWTVREGSFAGKGDTATPARMFASRRVIRPEPFDVEADARNMFRERMQAGDLPPGASPDDLLAAIRTHLLTRANTVPPGGRVAWTFRLPVAVTNAAFVLRTTVNASDLSVRRIEGLWSVSAPGSASGPGVKIAHTAGAVEEHALRLSLEKPSARAVVEFSNVHDQPVTVIFPPQNGLAMLLPESSYESNFLRGVLMILARLGFLAALGITAGSFFSLPVAAYVSAATVIVLQTSANVQALSETTKFFAKPGTGQVPGLLDALLRALFRAMHAAIEPLQIADPWSLVASGELIPWTVVCRTLAVHLIVYGGILAAAGAYVFNRKEIALSES